MPFAALPGKAPGTSLLDDFAITYVMNAQDLVPWKEAKSYWQELLDGQYEWSSIGKQLREKGLVSRQPSFDG